MVDAADRVVGLRLREAGVDNIDDTVDGDRGLCDIGGDDALPGAVRGILEDLQLALEGEDGIERQRPQRLGAQRPAVVVLLESLYLKARKPMEAASRRISIEFGRAWRR